MKKDLEKIFTARIIRYNFNEPFAYFKKEFKTHPSKEELLEFLEDLNKKDETRDYKTTIEVTESYSVVNN